MRSEKEIEAEILLRVSRQLALPRNPKTVKDIVEVAFNTGMMTALEWVKE